MGRPAPRLLPPEELSMAAKLIANVQLTGGVVRLVGLNLEVFPPRGGMSPGLRAALERHRIAVARLLGSNPVLASRVALKVMERRATPSPEKAAEPVPVEVPPPEPDRRQLQGHWVATGGGGRRFVLPRLKPPGFTLINKLDVTWQSFDSSCSDLRTRRALERRGLAEFKEYSSGQVDARQVAGISRQTWKRLLQSTK